MALPAAVTPDLRARGMTAALRDAGIAAVVAFALALPLVGFTIADASSGKVQVVTRFGWVAVGVASVFVMRLLLSAWRAARLRQGREGRFAEAGTAGGETRGRRFLRTLLPRRLARLDEEGMAKLGGGLLLLFAVALPFLPFVSGYIVDLATAVLIYVMLGWGLNVVVGLAGLLDLGYVAFYAVGAYSFALLARWYGFGFWEALPLSGLFAAAFGLVLGFPVLRLRGDYLAIVTLGFGEIIRIVLLNWAPVTGGPNGIPGIPRPTFFGLVMAPRGPEGTVLFHKFFGIPYNPEHRIIFLYLVILGLALATNFFTLRLRRLPLGRAWEALREDEIACRALGIDPTKVKLSAFAIGAMLGGFAGCFFAARLNFISPESFSFPESATILAIVVLGGMGSQMGVVLAATVLVTLPEFGRAFAEYRMLLFGAAMVGIMVWRPRGLLSRRAPSLRLAQRAAETP